MQKIKSQWVNSLIKLYGKPPRKGGFLLLIAFVVSTNFGCEKTQYQCTYYAKGVIRQLSGITCTYAIEYQPTYEYFIPTNLADIPFSIYDGQKVKFDFVDEATSGGGCSAGRSVKLLCIEEDI